MPHLVYLCESGAKTDDQVTTVAGIVVSRDDQWHHAVGHLNWVINKHVPEKLRTAGFIPRAGEVWGKNYRDSWPRESRMAFLHDLLYLVENSNLGLAWGKARDPTTYINAPKKLRPEEARHAFAFQLCMARADFGIGLYLPKHETMMCVCEDNNNREFLQWLAAFNRKSPLVIPAAPSLESWVFGTVVKGKEQIYSTGRMIDTVHFTERGAAPLIAVADVCAWAIKRYMGEKPLAEEFIRSLLTKRPLEDAFGNRTARAGSSSSGWVVPSHPFDPNDKSFTPPASLGFPSGRKSVSTG